MTTQIHSTRSVIRLLRLALRLADQHQDVHLAAKISESLDCAEQRLEALEKA